MNIDINKGNNINNNIQTKEINKEPNKKGKKAYLNFVQNIKKANKAKKNKIKNIFEPEPKVKLAKAVNKINIFSKGIFNINKNIINSKEEKEKEEQNLNKEEINKDENELNKNENDEPYDKYKEEIKTGYTGFILLKQTQGANIFQIKLEGTLDEINKIFKTHKIEIDGEQVELIHTKELEKLRKIIKNENEIINVKNNNEKVNVIKEKEFEENPLLAAVRKKTMENENSQREEENKKINEMKERIQKYKDELRKNSEIDDLIMKSARRERLSYHVKHKDIIEQKLRDLAMGKLSPKEETELLKNLNNKNIDKILENQNNKNNNIINNNNINNINIIEKEDKILKDQYNTINNEKDIKKEKDKKDEKEKERDKSYSRAMERFRKKYKNDNSSEIKSKKSEKINEMAKRLENVIGNQNTSTEIKNDNNISNEIVHENEKVRENNFEELLESKPVVAKKPKKKQKFQF